MNRTDGDTIYTSLRRALGASALAEANDEELLQQFAVHQDEAAFAALLRRHGPMVWGVCQRLVAHRQDAEDCFQATFLVLCRKAASIGRTHLLANWLFGVARRAALNAQARRARRVRHETSCSNLPDVPGTAPSPWDDTPSVLDEELARLPSRYRLPLLLCGLEGMTHAQASKSLGWPVGTVAGRLSRGRDLLRNRLQRRGVMAPAAVLPALLIADAASASVPPQLASASIRSAVAMFMAGRSAPADISATVAALVRGVLHKMFFHRLLTQSILAGVAALALSGAAKTWQLQENTEPSAPASTHSDLFSSAQRTTLTPAQGKPAICLPDDKNAVVIRMERAVDSSTLPGTKLMIYADGRVEAQVPEGLSSLAGTTLTEYVREYACGGDDRKGPPIKVLRGKLTPAELDDLVRFVVQDQEFFTLDPATVKARINDEYKRDWAVNDTTDESTIAITVQTADRNHQVSWSRLTRSIWDYPDVKPLRQLHGLDVRLAHSYYVLLAGGPEQVAVVVPALDALLLSYYVNNPLVPRLTAADLAGVYPAEDGNGTRYVFSRQNVDFGLRPWFSVTMTIPKLGKPFLNSSIPPQ